MSFLTPVKNPTGWQWLRIKIFGKKYKLYDEVEGITVIYYQYKGCMYVVDVIPNDEHENINR